MFYWRPSARMAEGGLSPPNKLSLDLDQSRQSLQWKKWINELQIYFTAAGITDDARQKALLLYLAGDEVREIYETLNDNFNTFNSAVTCLNGYFLDNPNLTFERFQFYSAHKKPGESSKAYITRLKTLASSCDFENYTTQDAICDHFITSCDSSTMRKKLLSTEKLSLAKLVKLTTTSEVVETQASVIEKATENLSINPVIKEEKEEINVIQSNPRNGRSSGVNYNRNNNYSINNTRPNARYYCYGCGSTKHLHRSPECPAIGKSCNKCGKPDHLSKVCLQKNFREKRNMPSEVVKNLDQPDSSDDEYIFHMGSGNNTDVFLKIENIKIGFLIDSGSTVTVIPQEIFLNLLKTKNIKLHPCDTKIYPYGSTSPIPLNGVFYANIEYNGTHTIGRVHVTPLTRGGCVLDRSTATELGLLSPIQQCENVLQMSEAGNLMSVMKTKYPEVFAGFGKMKDVQIKLKIDTSVQPVAQHLRRVPFHVRGKVENKLEELLKLGIIEKVTEPTPWVSPVVAVPKGEEVRLVVDMRRANEAILRNHYPIPTLEELLEEFNGCSVFSKIDLKMGYHLIELHPDSRPITTFSTHAGLFRYTRLVQGVSSALEEYQRVIGHLFKDHSRISNLVDDILIGGRNQQEHDENLDKCFKILKENNLTVNSEKCLISVPEVEFFGLKISAKGLSPTLDKIESIKHFPEPTSAKQLSSFLGMITYLARFVPNLAKETEPLRKLLRKGTSWEWGIDQKVTFTKLKSLITSNSVLAHYNISLETSLIVDASPSGLGAILLQTQIDGTQKPVSFASRTLTKQERKYSQTEREALAVVWGCERFHMYLYGCPFTILTDHQPLTILYNSSGKPSPRILRWGLRLQSYNYEIKHIPGKINPADYLSICPVPLDPKTSNKVEQLEQYVNSIIAYSVPKALTLSEILEESNKDPEIKKLIDCIQSNQWDKKDNQISTFRQVKEELSVKGGIILRGHSILIPKGLRDKTLKISHESHQGIAKTKLMVKDKVWWPKINQDIENMIKTCVACTSTSSVKPEPMTSFHMTAPWDRIHIDVCGPFPSGDYILGIIDASTRWPEIHIIRSTSSETIVRCMNKTFATHGFPSEIITDNAPNLISVDIKDYCNEKGIIHKSSIPYWPQGNSEIERFYKTLGKTIKRMNAEGRKWQYDIYQFLLDYRNTPHMSTNASPAKLLMNRDLKTKLPAINTSLTKEFVKAKERDDEQKAKSKIYYDKRKKAKHSPVKIGDFVLMKQQKKNKLTTNFCTHPAKVIQIDGVAVTLLYNNKTYVRNLAHVKKVLPSQYRNLNDSADDVNWDSDSDASSEYSTISVHFDNDASEHRENEVPPTIEHDPPDELASTIEQRPKRERKKPVRYGDFV